jgi:hypothetical protein
VLSVTYGPNKFVKSAPAGQAEEAQPLSVARVHADQHLRREGEAADRVLQLPGQLGGPVRLVRHVPAGRQAGPGADLMESAEPVIYGQNFIKKVFKNKC